MRTASLTVTCPSYRLSVLESSAPLLESSTPPPKLSAPPSLSGRLPVPGSFAPPSPFASDMHIFGLSAPSAFGASIPGSSALPSPSGRLPMPSLRMPGSFTPSLSNCLSVPGLSVPSASNMHMPRLFPPGLSPVFSIWSSP